MITIFAYVMIRFGPKTAVRTYFEKKRIVFNEMAKIF
jgi:hypothetical protein